MGIRIARGAKGGWRAGNLHFRLQTTHEWEPLLAVLRQIGDRLLEWDPDDEVARGAKYVSIPLRMPDLPPADQLQRSWQEGRRALEGARPLARRVATIAAATGPAARTCDLAARRSSSNSTKTSRPRSGPPRSAWSTESARGPELQRGSRWLTQHRARGEESGGRSEAVKDRFKVLRADRGDRLDRDRKADGAD